MLKTILLLLTPIILSAVCVFPQIKTKGLSSDKIVWDKSKKNTTELNNLLTDPLNLQEFKKLKTDKSNSGGFGSPKYLFRPNYKGFYYYYFLFRGFGEHGPRLVTYKKGTDIGEYLDSSEVFIQISSDEADADLGNANIAALSYKQIIEKFGNNYLTKDNLMIYQHNKTLLIISLNQKRWFKIVRLKRNYSSYKEIESEKDIISYN